MVLQKTSDCLVSISGEECLSSYLVDDYLVNRTIEHLLTQGIENCCFTSFNAFTFNVSMNRYILHHTCPGLSL
jgi:hypothetical protein